MGRQTHYWYKRLKRPQKWAFFLVTLLTVWVLSGVLLNSYAEDSDVVERTINLPVGSVQIQSSVSQEIQRHVTINGQTLASKDVNLAARTSGEVVEIVATEGQLIKKGAPIVRLDIQDREERLIALNSLVEQRQKEYDASRKLANRGFDSTISRARAKAALDQAKADLKQLRLDIEFVTVTAPFDGVIETINVDVGDFAGVGVFGVEGAIARIVDLDPLIVHGSISQKDRTYVDVNAPIIVTLIDGRSLEGSLQYLSKTADIQSRSFPFEVKLQNTELTLLSGLSATIRVPLNTLKAHLVPSSALSLSDIGAVQLKTLDRNRIVQTVAVSIVQEEERGLLVSGLPDDVTLITLGHHYVTQGQFLDESVTVTVEPL